MTEGVHMMNSTNDYAENLNALILADRQEPTSDRFLFHLAMACANVLSPQDFAGAIATAKRRMRFFLARSPSRNKIRKSNISTPAGSKWGR